MLVAIIPARGGSKRIPGKNIRSFCGKPIISYSILAALESRIFDRVIVSTDSDEIGAVATQYGAEVPFRRPAELANDHTATLPVIRHAINSLESEGNSVDFACCIYPTAPFLSSDDLREGIRLLKENGTADFCISCTNFGFPIWRSFAIENGQASMFWPEHLTTRSQDLVEAYHDAGQFYWGSAASFIKHDGFFTSCCPLVIPRYRVQDIDTEEDWIRAEKMFQAEKSV